MSPDATRPTASLSVVSHAQADMVSNLLGDIKSHVKTPIEVILTLNVPEALPFSVADFPFPLKIIANRERKGFGANHNHAFERASGEYFVVLNPDIRFVADPLPQLVEAIASDVGIVAPMVLNVAGDPEDSARRFPTLANLLCKAITSTRNIDYPRDRNRIFPDWVAGMFMLLPRDVFARLGGFDERYFLYYEDVDLCVRLCRAGYSVCQVTHCTVTHEAQRRSHRDLRYLRWHLASMMRYMLSYPRLALFPRRAGKPVRND